MFYVWLRNKYVGMESLDGFLRITTGVHETYFEGRVTIMLRLQDLEIVSLEATMPRPINEECRAALAILQKVVGMRVASGLTKRVDEAIGGRNGCTHMANLVLESCHAAAIGFRQVRMGQAIAAGLKSEDYYAEWIRTRPKELLNSCVAFMEGSPLFARMRSASPETVQERRSTFNMTTPLPILSFSRNKIVGVGRLHRDVLLARARLEDNAHSMAVEVEFSRPDLQIIAVRGEMPRTPNDVCPTAVDALQKAVGLGIRPGLTAAVDEQIGRNGCPHLANLLLEACHGVIQGSLGAQIDETRADGLELSWDEQRARWLEAMPTMRGSCLAYAEDSSLMRRLGLGVTA